MYEPKTEEIEGELMLDTGCDRQVIIVPKSNLTADKSKNAYAMPVDDMVWVADNVYAYVTDTYLGTAAKKLFDYLTSDVYIGLDLTNYSVLNYPDIATSYKSGCADLNKSIVSKYPTSPALVYKLLKEQRLDPTCELGDTTVDLLTCLPTQTGVKTWSNLTRQQLYLLFQDKRLVTIEDTVVGITEFQRSLGCSNLTSPKYPKGQATQLSIFFAPFGKAYQTVYADSYQLYPLIQFAHWVYVASTKLATRSHPGLIILTNTNRKGESYVTPHCQFSLEAIAYWNKLVCHL